MFVRYALASVSAYQIISLMEIDFFLNCFPNRRLLCMLYVPVKRGKGGKGVSSSSDLFISGAHIEMQ